MNVRPKRPIEVTRMVKREKARAYYEKNKEASRKKAAEYRKKNPGYHAQYKKRKDAVKERARILLREAVRYGKIERPSQCSICGSVGQIHGHHSDYSKPYDVMWLCPPCHGKQHRIESQSLALVHGRGKK